MDPVRVVLAVVPALGIVLGSAVSAIPQPGRIPRVGYLPSASMAPSPAQPNPTLQALRQERLPELAAELVGLNVDVIVTLGGVATRAAKNATSTIPIVFVVVIELILNLETARSIDVTIPPALLKRADRVIQ
jgi:putative ABC transport system substrate-binding protein